MDRSGGGPADRTATSLVARSLFLTQEKFMKPEYTSDRRRSEILYECLRHKVAHLAYPYAVFDTTTARSKTFDGQPRRR